MPPSAIYKTSVSLLPPKANSYQLFLFLIGGLIIAGLQYNEARDAVSKLARYDANAQWSVPVNGKVVTVGELREIVLREPINLLLVNLLLAAIMAGLYYWSKRAPLPAILVATGTYLAVVVLSAIVNPETLWHGIVMKIIIIALLYRGIRSGFEQRSMIK